jgi:acyl-CoA thioester hydrolase
MDMKVKIYYHDTDSGGVVYYANYLKFLEEARTEFFAERGIKIKDLAQDGTLFVVARQEIDYKAPAFYGDILEVKTWVSGSSTAKIEFSAEIRNQENKLISLAKTILVCVGSDLRPKPLPEEIRQRLGR